MVRTSIGFTGYIVRALQVGNQQRKRKKMNIKFFLRFKLGLSQDVNPVSFVPDIHVGVEYPGVPGRDHAVF